MKLVLISALVLVSLTACTPEERSPSKSARTQPKPPRKWLRTPAVAQGVVDGVKDKGPVNINKASSGVAG